MSSAPATPIPKEGVESPKAGKGKAKASPKKAPMKAAKAVASPKKTAMKAVASPKTAAMKSAIAAKATAMKAKAKASVKAKAGTSKAAKGVGKGQMDPAGKENEGDGNPIKRPAAAKGSLKDLQVRLLEAAAADSDKDEDHEEEEEAEDEDDVEVDNEGTTRDRCKRDKFHTLLSQNKLPGHITDMWFKGVQNEKNKRGFKTKIINALFERDTKGRLIMKPEAPFFTSYKQTQERKSFGVEQTGLPRGVFRGMYFQNSEEALQEALDNNEVEVVTQGGRDWYSFIRLRKTHEVSKLGNQKIVTQQKKIDGDACKSLEDAWDQLDWGFKPKASSNINKNDTKNINAAAPLAIQDAAADHVYFAKVESLFSDAKGALERLQKDLMKLAPLVASDPKHAQSVSLYCIVSNSAHTSSIFCCC